MKRDSKKTKADARSAFKTNHEFESELTRRGCDVGQRLGLGLLRGLNFDRIKLRSINYVFLALDLRLFIDGGFWLHLAASFEHRPLLDHQRWRLNIAVEFGGATQLDAVGRNDVAVNDSMDSRWQLQCWHQPGHQRQ